MIVNLDDLDKEQGSLFNQLKKDVIGDFNSLSSKLLDERKELLWYINNVTSRNTNSSKLLYYMQCIALLKRLREKDIVDKVITSDPCLYKLLNPYYTVELGNRFIALQKPHIRIKEKLYPFYHNILWSIGAFLNKSKERVDRIKTKENVTIIDVDIAKKTDRYNDRYYGDVLDRIPPYYSNKSFYMIIYLPVPIVSEIMSIERNTNHNVLFLWDFLSITDYFKCFYKMLKYRPPKLVGYQYENIKLDSYLQAISKSNFSFYYYVALLYYQVIYNMKKRGIDIGLYVDWFENQSFDRSFYLAMNRYYPGVAIHSFIGFLVDTTINPFTIVTNKEVEIKIAPKEIFLSSQALVDVYKEFNYKGVIRKAPCYRVQKVWSVERKMERTSTFNIVIPLDLNLNDIKAKLSFLKRAKDNDCLKYTSIVIKPHPVFDITIIKSIVGNMEGCQIVEGDIYNFFEIADCIIASNSTSTYEALSMGIPAISLNLKESSSYINCPKNVPTEMWYEVNDNDSIQKAVDEIRLLDPLVLQKKGELIREYYFEEETEAKNDIFFNI